MRSLILSLSLVLLAGCSAPEGPGSASPPKGMPVPGHRPGVPLADILALALDTQTLLDRLDPPGRIEAEPVANRHVPGQTDTLRTYHYEGLALTVYDVTGSGVMLQTVEVTGYGYTTPDGLGIGSPRAEVERVYPRIEAVEGDTVAYEHRSSPDDPTPATVRVRYDAEGQAAALTWSFYVD